MFWDLCAFGSSEGLRNFCPARRETADHAENRWKGLVLVWINKLAGGEAGAIKQKVLHSRLESVSDAALSDQWIL